ncbi:hypothetical protein G6M26_31060 [Agrobacterium tumefaciens]|nr:hypothetical protein [Agrobacterium tumefaciens]NTE22992.1 hypothetical protein [Agrobacterium tumefaciens]
MAMVVRKFNMFDHDQAADDLKYWLSKSPLERISAVTYLVNQTLKPRQKIDKIKFRKI